MNSQNRDIQFEGKSALGPFLKRIFSHSYSYTAWFWMLVLNIMFVGAIDALYPLIWMQFIDQVMTPAIETLKTSGSTQINWSGLKKFGLIYLAFAVGTGLGVGGFIYAAGRIQEYVMYDLRKAMFNKLQSLSFSFYDKSATGWLISRITSDADRVTELISWGFLELVWGCSMIVFCFVVMLFLNWKLAFIVLATIPVLIIVAIKVRVLILKYSRRARRLNSEMTASFNEHINGAAINKSTVQEDRVSGEFSELSSKMRKASFRSAYYTAMYMPLVVMVGSIAAAAVIYSGGHMVIEAETGVTIGLLAAFFGYARNIFEPIFDITRFYALAHDSLSAGERIYSLVDEEVEIKNGDDPIQLNRLKGNIDFKNVCFSYIPEKQVLKYFNLTIASGESIALVGPTGEGKTTISGLISRFYDINSGQLLIDGYPIQQIDLNSLRSRMGVIQQNPHLFKGTIEENLRYGNPSVQRKQIIETLTRLGATEFIQRLKEDVGEDGELLSIGEKQILSIARTILRDPAIFILDEATSSVDTVTEARIQKGIEQLMKGRTSVIIAHRLSTIKQCDRILVINKGQIAEMGNHDQLIAQKGYYHKLYMNQLGK